MIEVCDRMFNIGTSLNSMMMTKTFWNKKNDWYKRKIG